jgi:D-serine deaminase-like pyridoxal phosphate-dependent protein
VRIADIDTPALVLDLDRVEHNIDTMARFFAGQRAGLRPHFKTPKCPEIARRQLAAGAIGITCAKLGEAEVIADAGLEASVLIANQIVGPLKVERLVALGQRLPELLFAVDAAEQIDAVDAAARGSSARLGAVIEVDVGMKRCGTDTPEQTVALAKHIVQSGVPYRGIMGYEGHAVLVPDEDKRKSLAEASMARLSEHREALEAAGLAPEIVSAGGTGTHDLSGRTPGVTEIQAGSYVFMDGAYQRVRSEFRPALTVLTTVVHRRGRILITDCGMKALSHEFGMPRGATLPLECVGLSEEHGHVRIDEGHDLDLAPGDRIALLPSHGDTTINLHESYHVVRGEEVEAVWPIAARGKFR